MKKFGVFELSFLSFKNKVNLIKNNTMVTFLFFFIYLKQKMKLFLNRERDV